MEKKKNTNKPVYILLRSIYIYIYKDNLKLNYHLLVAYPSREI